MSEQSSAARLDYQTGWRAWIVDRLLAVAVWAARSASRLDSHQEFGVWERSRQPSESSTASVRAWLLDKLVGVWCWWKFGR